MKNAYSELAAFYDRLNGEVDYNAWSAFLISLLEEHGIGKGSTLLDAGCGTGQITVRLAKAGYDMIGVDLSPEMLSLARALSESESVSPLFLCQDISEIDLYGTVRAAISTLDSLNYLTKKEAFESFFSRIRNFIEPGGLLIFDLNTKYKFERVYGDNDYILEDDGVFCGWSNHYSASTRLASFSLSIFERLQNGDYARRDEYQQERFYPDSTVKKLLDRFGFDLVAMYSDIDRTPADPSRGSADLRRFFVCKKR